MDLVLGSRIHIAFFIKRNNNHPPLRGCRMNLGYMYCIISWISDERLERKKLNKLLFKMNISS
jgi:hypothetical protein